jgi:hypothetical protein
MYSQVKTLFRHNVEVYQREGNTDGMVALLNVRYQRAIFHSLLQFLPECREYSN